MSTIKIGGVPEHFNMPWHFMKQKEGLMPEGIDFQWDDYPGGTGDLVKALEDGSLDLATLLTEGAIKGIDSGSSFKILNFFVDSPLIWGVHVPAGSEYQEMNQIKGKRYAISRYGSGSHLISYLDTKNRKWSTKHLDFVEVGGLEGAREAFREKRAEVFLWEKFTTKPLVDNGEFRLIGECIPNFSSFVICVSKHAWETNQADVKKLLNQVLKASRLLTEEKHNTQIIANHYRMQVNDIEAWLQRTEWTVTHDLDAQKLNAAIDILKDLTLVKDSLKVSDLVVK